VTTTASPYRTDDRAGAVLERIRANSISLSAAEQLVARTVLADPVDVVHLR
jgi:DNA-binding MurR/RpiR family transcriptional regulator